MVVFYIITIFNIDVNHQGAGHQQHNTHDNGEEKGKTMCQSSKLCIKVSIRVLIPVI